MSPLFSVLFIGFAAGVVHAFDPDHLAAVGGMSGRDKGRYSLRFALHWGLGHGLAVLGVASAVLLAGSAIPYDFSAIAEALVAWMLIVIGLLSFYHLWRQHQHHDSKQGVRRSAVGVGLIHGSAGSAPLLAVIPAAGLASPSLGMAHVLLFNLGLIVAMAAVGLALRGGFAYLGKRHHYMQHGLQSLAAMFAIGFGFSLLLSH
ncbi:hypothetical protein HNQ57_002039 [Zhongshania antarctica]|jgi:hypothetical protein|uniref:Nickel/cobalt efflux system n=1 Tax=Zhongshania antarctica TaxID=641702 RepID=A0A840R5W1_9GAMM|nr:urease accessory protein UreH [Zhongshania antarctica]MBB5187761.1 hypothetical protein [Zhongshania antarctica]